MLTSDMLRDDLGMASLGHRLTLLSARDHLVGAGDDASGLHSAALDAAQHSAAAALAAIDGVNLLETLTQSVLSLHDKLNTIASTIPGAKPHPSTFALSEPSPSPAQHPVPRAKGNASSKSRRQKAHAPARPFTSLPSVVTWGGGVLPAAAARQGGGTRGRGEAGRKALTDTRALSSKDAKGNNVTMSRLTEVKVPTNVTMSKLSEVAFEAKAPAVARAPAKEASIVAGARGGAGGSGNGGGADDETRRIGAEFQKGVEAARAAAADGHFGA